MRRERVGRLSNRFSISWVVPATVMAVALSTLEWNARTRGDEPPAEATAGSEKEKAEKRMKFMLQALERYEVVYPGDPPQTSRLHAKPLLRWTNPVTTIKDGTLAVYTRGGRPDVVVEFQVHNEVLSGHEFSPIRFEGMRLRRNDHTVFSADNGWFKFQDLPDAPRPAEKAVQRLAQMRQIAERFTVVDIFGRIDDEVQQYNLRLMPQPVYRYEEADAKIDGGMFVFAQGTNPEAVLLVEALREGEKPGWRYGFAPTTTYELTAHLGGEDGPVVWSKPRYQFFDMTTGPYLAGFYPPGPDDISLKGLMPDRKAKAEPSSKE
jgi:hypothetical protein